MIRINLLKSAPKKATVEKAGIPKWIPSGIGVIILLILVGGAGTWYLKTQKKSQPLPVVIEQKTEFKPSTHVKPNMLEEVVKEVNDERNTNQRSGIINLTYEEMSFAEKINYEILFGKNVFDSLSKIIPTGIGFKTLDIDNFTTMYSIGLGSNSDLVAKTFAQLKERLGLLPQPYSYIKGNGTKGYKFIITCKPIFGVNLASPYQPFDHLFSRDELSTKLSRFSAIAVQSGLRTSGKPLSITVEKIRDYQRFEYEWKCSGTYKIFVQFINSIYEEQLPCAFKSIHISAKAENNVDISTTLIFTVKE